MKTIRKLGIWMDHSDAYLMEFANDVITTNIIVSESGHPEDEFSSEKHEKLIQKKEQHQQLSYYKKLSQSIRDYQEVVPNLYNAPVSFRTK
jgi:hypothetical protein